MQTIRKSLILIVTSLGLLPLGAQAELNDPTPDTWHSTTQTQSNVQGNSSSQTQTRFDGRGNSSSQTQTQFDEEGNSSSETKTAYQPGHGRLSPKDFEDIPSDQELWIAETGSQLRLATKQTYQGRNAVALIYNDGKLQKLAGTPYTKAVYHNLVEDNGDPGRHWLKAIIPVKVEYNHDGQAFAKFRGFHHYDYEYFIELPPLR
jgi:hypothetical protein